MKHGQDLKTTLIVLAECGAPLKGLGCDTMVASYLLNPAKHSFELADTVLDHLGRQVPSAKEAVGSGARAVPFCLAHRGEGRGSMPAAAPPPSWPWQRTSRKRSPRPG